MNQRKAYILAIIVVLAWSTVATAFKIALNHISHIQLLVWANIASVIVLGISILIQNKGSLLLNFSKKDFGFSFLTGLLNPFIYYLVLFKAYDLLLAQEAQAINYTWAILLPFFAAVFLKQKLSIKDFLTALVAYFGLYIIICHGNLLSLKFSNVTGVILAFASTFVWCTFWVMKTKSKLDTDCSLFLSFLFSLPFSLLLCLHEGQGIIVNFEGITAAIYIGIFEMGLSYILWNKALKLSDKASRISQLVFLAPCLSFLIIALVTDERILPSSILGLAIIIISLLVSKNFEKIKRISQLKSCLKIVTINSLW